MIRRLPLGVLLAAGLVLTGCSGDPSPAGSDSPAAPSTAPPSASASPAPSSTLSAEQQQAVDEAAEVVLRYEQMQVDLLADPEPYLNDLNNVAADPQLDIDLQNLQQTLVAGNTEIESSGPVTLAAVEPVKIRLTGKPPTVTLLVCVDSSAVSGSFEGKPTSGKRQSIQYRVIKTTYLPAPGWAVAQVLPPDGFDQPQPC